MARCLARTRVFRARLWPDRVRAAAIWSLLCLLCLLVPPEATWSHAILVASDPEHGTVLDEAPDAAALRFNATLETAVTRVHLVDTHRTKTPLKAVNVSRAQIIVELPPLPPGVYTVVYKVLARDGHVTEGSIRFTIRVP